MAEAVGKEWTGIGPMNGARSGVKLSKIVFAAKTQAVYLRAIWACVGSSCQAVVSSSQKLDCVKEDVSGL